MKGTLSLVRDFFFGKYFYLKFVLVQDSGCQSIVSRPSFVSIFWAPVKNTNPCAPANQLNQKLGGGAVFI